MTSLETYQNSFGSVLVDEAEFLQGIFEAFNAFSYVTCAFVSCCHGGSKTQKHIDFSLQLENYLNELNEGAYKVYKTCCFNYIDMFPLLLSTSWCQYHNVPGGRKNE